MHFRWFDISIEMPDEDFPPTVRAKPGMGVPADLIVPAPTAANQHDFRSLPQEQDDAIKVHDFFVFIRMRFQS